MEIQFGYLRFSLCHDDFATQIALDIPLRSVFLHLRHKNLAEIIRNIQNITNFVDGDYDDGRLPTVDGKPLDVQRLCPTAHSSVAHAPAVSAWGGGSDGRGLDLAEGAAARAPSFASLAKCFFLARWLKLPTFALSNKKKFNIFKTQVWKLRRFTTSSSSMPQARWKSSTTRHSQA